jgi:hypothetical protein
MKKVTKKAMERNERLHAAVSDALEGVCENLEEDLRKQLESIKKLVEAIQSELDFRDNMDLTRAITVAFRIKPPSEKEKLIINSAAQSPGIQHSELLKSIDAKGINGTLARIADRPHLKKFSSESAQSSGLFFARDKSEGSMGYSLTPEAERAFRDLKII